MVALPAFSGLNFRVATLETVLTALVTLGPMLTIILPEPVVF